MKLISRWNENEAYLIVESYNKCNRSHRSVVHINQKEKNLKKNKKSETTN